jgi:hypothetical protein
MKLQPGDSVVAVARIPLEDLKKAGAAENGAEEKAN